MIALAKNYGFDVVISILLGMSLYSSYQDEGWSGVFWSLAIGAFIFFVFFIGILGLVEWALRRRMR